MTATNFQPKGYPDTLPELRDSADLDQVSETHATSQQGEAAAPGDMNALARRSLRMPYSRQCKGLELAEKKEKLAAANAVWNFSKNIAAVMMGLAWGLASASSGSGQMPYELTFQGSMPKGKDLEILYPEALGAGAALFLCSLAILAAAYFHADRNALQDEVRREQIIYNASYNCEEALEVMLNRLEAEAESVE